MTKMPIARSVISRGKIRTPGQPVADPAKLRNFLREATHFRVQTASELYWSGSQNDYNLSKDFGPLRLPFPTVWMEWSCPSQGIVEGKKSQLDPYNAACYLREQPYEDGILIVAVTLIGGDAENAPYLIPVRLVFQVDDDGNYVGGTNGVRCFHDSAVLTPAEFNTQRELAMNQLNVACLALNLINCKNVGTEVSGKTHIPRGPRNRKEPTIEYRTIRLPGSPCGGEATGENEGTMPHHRVRGHFKKFTPDSPLLGKHTGTYWWGWQVRGKKANGEVISDYELKDAS